MTMQSSKPDFYSRIRGSFYGLAVTDALGAPVEFQARGTFPKVTSMLPNPNFNLPPGHFTDDTSMALCLLASLSIYTPTMHALDQARKYITWWREGRMSSTGYCFDIGTSTREVLEVWEAKIRSAKEENDRLIANEKAMDRDSHADVILSEEEELWAGLESDDDDDDSDWDPATWEFDVAHEMKITLAEKFSGESRCGNGALMRTLPVALLYLGNAQDADESTATSIAIESCAVTHPHRRCMSCCALYVKLIGQTLDGYAKRQLCGYVHAVLVSQREVMKNSPYGVDEPLHERFEVYKTLGDWEAKPVAEISSSGYVLDSLEAALWAFFTTSSFREGAIKVVNLGDDADTVGAIYGGLAGAYYGFEEIPKDWLDKMKSTDLLETAVDTIMHFRWQPPSESPDRMDIETNDVEKLMGMLPGIMKAMHLEG
ncbi:uncharacterized protein HMPREF1541_01118 [Cyphellophora europaea CBS 101466]|uniref:ADP-ribosylhydrolase ARH3 n=1 Tax=Cyphellophora europaea (strain CBS 101466) TaxID=1220924 RepID=W2SGD4_CYPE1|nr:uncharacterized protein HMPREF1541_01118 [Cyphellophora europaea CBS 101466]ETN46929.1 hypothetical protein HMPREF1541_01118 [Cyphellophora europaea CBS 101466]